MPTENPAAIIDGETGAVIQCAKDLGTKGANGCGYAAGSNICGKCGALPFVQEGKGGMGAYMGDMPKPKKKMKGKPGAIVPDEDMVDDEMMEEEMPKKAMRAGAMPPAEDADMEEDMEDEEMEEDEEVMEDAVEEGAKKKMWRNRRLRSMGLKSDEFSDEDYVCAVERKMHDAGAPTCASCTGGCTAAQDGYSLLEIEGIAEDLFDGKVLASGYASDVDVFIVDVHTKDGKVAEAFFFGDDGECFRWNLRGDLDIAEKSLFGIEDDVISPEEARDIALEHIEGKAVLVDVDTLDGEYVYVVEIEGNDEKSYDAYISVKGDFIDYEDYDADEIAEIDAEVAEIAVKRMYSEEMRMQLAEEGMALPDGSYPIKDQADLRNAIQAYGRAKDPEAAKRHIMKRAEELDAMDMIPEKWMADKKDDPDADSEVTETKGEEAELLVSLMEFELLAAEEEIKDIL